jgi:hypothetical protein
MWPVAGTSVYKLTSSQLSGIKYANPNVIPYLAVAIFANVYRFEEYYIVGYNAA